MSAQDKNRFGRKQMKPKSGSQLAGSLHTELRLRHANLVLPNIHIIVCKNTTAPNYRRFSVPVPSRLPQ